MQAELADQGYQEGNNLDIISYSLEHHMGKARNIWKKETRTVTFDAVFVNGTLAAQAFQEIAESILTFPLCSQPSPIRWGKS